jgi:predicted 3-demethylubiquinone-9 3-methyltransferase (glyoxalase superfamily)
LATHPTGGEHAATKEPAMPAIAPCLWFDTQAQDAAEFYVSVFPNSRIVDTLHYTDADPGKAGSVLLVSFELDGKPFTALNGGTHFTIDEAISFQIDCAGQDDVEHYWSRLTDGGEEGPCGWCKDRFGVSWQVVPARIMELWRDSDPQTAARVTERLYKMKKIVIAELEEAAGVTA